MVSNVSRQIAAQPAAGAGLDRILRRCIRRKVLYQSATGVSRPAMDETGVFSLFLFLSDLHFCFLLGRDFSHADNGFKQGGVLTPAGCLLRITAPLDEFFRSLFSPTK